MIMDKQVLVYNNYMELQNEFENKDCIKFNLKETRISNEVVDKLRNRELKIIDTLFRMEMHDKVKEYIENVYNTNMLTETMVTNVLIKIKYFVTEAFKSNADKIVFIGELGKYDLLTIAVFYKLKYKVAILSTTDSIQSRLINQKEIIEKLLDIKFEIRLSEKDLLNKDEKEYTYNKEEEFRIDKKDFDNNYKCEDNKFIETVENSNENIIVVGETLDNYYEHIKEIYVRLVNNHNFKDLTNENKTGLTTYIESEYVNDICLTAEVIQIIENIANKETNVSIANNRKTLLIYWMKRIFKDIDYKNNEKYNLLIFSDTHKNKLALIKVLCKISNLKFVFICKGECAIEINEIKNVKLVRLAKDVNTLDKFPTDDKNVRIATTIAYNAKDEVDKSLFSGDNLGLYRERQFSKCTNLILKCTYDEIKLYWNKENKFRPYFDVINESDGKKVVTPSFFSKVCGVVDNKSYYEDMKNLLKNNSLLMIGNKLINLSNKENEVTVYNKYYCEHMIKAVGKDYKIDFKAVINDSKYKLGHLDINVQHNLIDKIESLINGSYIENELYRISKKEIAYTATEILFTMDSEITKLIQGYDYTKISPKVVVVMADEETLTLETSILLMVLSLVGFDIILSVPTYYNISKFISDEVIQTINNGDANFNIDVERIVNEARKERDESSCNEKNSKKLSSTFIGMMFGISD